jgi:hypothetical protein
MASEGSTHSATCSLISQYSSLRKPGSLSGKWFRPYSLAYLFEVGFIRCIIFRISFTSCLSLSHISDRTHVSSPSPFHPVAYFQSLLSLLTDDTPPPPSSNTRSSNFKFTFAAAFPSSLSNVHIPTRSPSRHSPSRQPVPSRVRPHLHLHLFHDLSVLAGSSSDSGQPIPDLGFGDATMGRKPASRQGFERDYEREGEDDYAYGGHGYGYGYQQPGLARAMSQNRPPGFNTT